jgi:hypothetical protein
MASKSRAFDAPMAEVADGHVAVAEPHRDGAAFAHRPVDIEALLRVEQGAQRLVAQASRIQAAELSGGGFGGEREQEVGGRDPRVPEPVGLTRGGLERSLGRVGERP